MEAVEVLRAWDMAVVGWRVRGADQAVRDVVGEVVGWSKRVEDESKRWAELVIRLRYNGRRAGDSRDMRMKSREARGG